MLQPSEEIKSKLDIVDFIRDYIPLKQAGVNFSARCPFHQEKTPSFIVSPDKQIWHCFGCGKGGDIFSFLMEMEGIDFVEALRVLASKAGVTLRKQDPKLTSQRNRLLDINELARKYYHKILLEHESAEAARKYLRGRGLADDTIEYWQLGYSPDSWDTTLKLLKSRGYTENEIFLAGLAVRGTKRPGFYDRFRGRIMFPINDINGNTVAFTARVSPEKEAEERMGKYINSPQTMIYDKSRILFGLDKARQEIKKRDYAIVVEGQMDVITAHQHSYGNTVAASSTALTREHIALLKRYSLNVDLAFDMDEAGRAAVDRGAREAMAAEMNVKVIILPEGKDPDECLRKNPGGWKEAVKAAKPVMQYYFDEVFGGLNTENVDNRRLAAKKLLPKVARLGNKIEQDYWLKQLCEKIDVEERVLRETLTALIKPERSARELQPESHHDLEPDDISREERLSELLLSLAMKFPSLLEYLINNIQIDLMVGRENQFLYRNLIFYYNNAINDDSWKVSDWEKNALNYDDFKSWLTERMGDDEERSGEGREKQLKTLDKLVILGDKEFSESDNSSAKEEAIKMVSVLKKFYLANRMKEVEKMIAEYEKKKDEKAVGDLIKEFKALADEISEIDGFNPI